MELRNAEGSPMLVSVRGMDLNSRKDVSRSLWLTAFLLTKSLASAE